MQTVPSTTLQPKKRKGSVTRQLLLIGTVLMVLFWVGCTVTKKNYAMLSRFFDGVPDPNAPIIFDREIISQSANFSEHRPYIDDSCFECHTDASDMTLEKGKSEMCMKCHSEVTEQYPMMHGAVSGVACLMCHNPHYSALLHLLRDDGVGMCTQCHDKAAESKSHPRLDPEQKCIDCHNAHGGSVKFFLDDYVDIKQDNVEVQNLEEVDGL